MKSCLILEMAETSQIVLKSAETGDYVERMQKTQIYLAWRERFQIPPSWHVSEPSAKVPWEVCPAEEEQTYIFLGSLPEARDPDFYRKVKCSLAWASHPGSSLVSGALEELLTVPDPPDESKAMAVALDSFPAGENGELVLRLGEPLTIISDNGDWWRVMSEATNQEFSIPSSHVAKISHGWLYEGLNREKAEDLLLLPSNHGGSFLIRDSQTRRGAYSLSVRLSRPISRDVVRHYRIHRLENGWFYISPRFTFPSLQALVDHYTEMADDLCSLLKEPCAFYRVDPLPSKNIPPPVSVQKPALNWEEVDSSLLFSEVSASGDTSPISVGLREAIGTYISMTEDPSLDISGQRRLKKGNKDKAL